MRSLQRKVRLAMIERLWVKSDDVSAATLVILVAVVAFLGADVGPSPMETRLGSNVAGNLFMASKAKL